MKLNKKKTIFLTSIALACSIGISTIALGGGYSFRMYYRGTDCTECEWKHYDDSQKDSYGNSRQYGLKLCDSHLKEYTKDCTFLDYGYSDYNCMAYAIGKTGPCEWEWPASWGASPTVPTVKKYFEKLGYTTEDYDEDNLNGYKEKDAIFVYGIKYGPQIVVQHFSRANALDGTDIGNNATASKWGCYAIYKTKDVDCYKRSMGYGECAFVCYK